MLPLAPAPLPPAQRRRFSFSLLVHSDSGSPMLDFLPSSSVLQVRRHRPGRAGGVPGGAYGVLRAGIGQLRGRCEAACGS